MIFFIIHVDTFDKCHIITKFGLLVTHTSRLITSITTTPEKNVLKPHRCTLSRHNPHTQCQTIHVRCLQFTTDKVWKCAQVRHLPSGSTCAHFLWSSSKIFLRMMSWACNLFNFTVWSQNPYGTLFHPVSMLLTPWFHLQEQHQPLLFNLTTNLSMDYCISISFYCYLFISCILCHFSYTDIILHGLYFKPYCTFHRVPRVHLISEWLTNGKWHDVTVNGVTS